MKEILLILFRRKNIAVFFAICMILFPMSLSYVLKEKYESSASVLLTAGRFKKPFLPNELDTRTGFVQVSAEDVASEVELLQSRPVLEEVVRKNQLDVFGEPGKDEFLLYLLHNIIKGLNNFLVFIGLKYPISDFDLAVVKLESKIDVEFIKRSNIITVEWKGRTPELAQNVVQTVVEEYIKHHILVHGSQNAIKTIRFELEQNEDYVKEVEKNIGAIKSKYDIYDVEKEREAALEEFLEAKKATEALEQINESSIISTSRGFYAEDPVFVSLLNELIQLELQMIENTARYGKNDKRVSTVNKQILSVQQKIKKEHTKNISAWSEAEVQYKTLLDNFGEAQSQLSTLNRELLGAKEAYQISRQKYNEVQISAAMDEDKIASVQIVSPASYSDSPASPKRMLFLFISIFLAGVGGIAACFAAEKLYSRIVSDDEIPDLSDGKVEYLFSIPEVGSKHMSDESYLYNLMARKMSPLGPFIESKDNVPNVHLLLSPNENSGTSFLANNMVNFTSLSTRTKAICLRVEYENTTNFTDLNNLVNEAKSGKLNDYIKVIGNNKHLLEIVISNDELLECKNKLLDLINSLGNEGFANIFIDLPNKADDYRYLNFLDVAQNIYINIAYDMTDRFGLKRMLKQIGERTDNTVDGIVFSRKKNPIPEFIYRRL